MILKTNNTLTTIDCQRNINAEGKVIWSRALILAKDIMSLKRTWRIK